MGCTQALPRRRLTISSFFQDTSESLAITFIRDSAFFQGISEVCILQLAEYAKELHVKKIKVPFSIQNSCILLGGVKLIWDYGDLMTIRRDVVNEEGLLIQENEGDSKKEGVVGATVLLRNELEYLYASPYHYTWFMLNFDDIFRVKLQSKEFGDFFDTTIRPRANIRKRARLFGLLSSLTRSEYHYISQAFDFVSLKSFVDNSFHGSGLLLILDGSLQVTVSPEISSLSTQPADDDNDDDLEEEKKEEEDNNISLKLTLNSMDLLGENFVLLDQKKPIVEYEVKSPGVGMLLKRTDWNLFWNNFVSDATKKLFIEEEINLRKYETFISFFPCFRKLSQKLYTILVTIMTSMLIDENENQIDNRHFTLSTGNYLYLVQKGDGHIVRNNNISDDDYYEEGYCLGYENIHKPNSQITFETSSKRTQLLKIPIEFMKYAFEQNDFFQSDFEFLCYRKDVSIFTILNHPIAITHFQKHVEEGQAGENLHFYLFIKYFDKHPDFYGMTNKEKALKILNEFCYENAPHQLNIRSETANTLRSIEINNDISFQQVKTIFQDTFDEVESILVTDLFPRFREDKEKFQLMILDVLDSAFSDKKSARSRLTASSLSTCMSLKDIRG